MATQLGMTRGGQAPAPLVVPEAAKLLSGTHGDIVSVGPGSRGFAARPG